MKAKKIFWGIILAIAMIVIAGGTCFIVMYFFSDNDNKEFIETQVSTDPNLAENHNINWKKLMKRNKDVYSWVYVPGTKVDHVVVQAPKSKSDLWENSSECEEIIEC